MIIYLYFVKRLNAVVKNMQILAHNFSNRTSIFDFCSMFDINRHTYMFYPWLYLQRVSLQQNRLVSLSQFHTPRRNQWSSAEHRKISGLALLEEHSAIISHTYFPNPFENYLLKLTSLAKGSLKRRITRPIKTLYHQWKTRQCTWINWKDGRNNEY